MLLKNVQTPPQICISIWLFGLLQLPIGSVYAAGTITPSINNSGQNSGAIIINPVSSISDVYSDIDMRVRLSTKTNVASCAASQCELNQIFDKRVSAIGRYLTKAASQLYPHQEKLIQGMTFSVADKQEAGTASNNKGQIVVLRGVQDLQLDDDALGFVIAREMSHVMAGHHSTNTSAKLIISALASVLFPAVAIIGASTTAAQASTATTLLTSAASTATSMVGGEVAIAKMKPSQLSQADEIARTIMEKCDWDMRAAESVLTQDAPPQSAWMLDLNASRYALQTMIEKEDAEVVLLEDEDVELAQQTISSDGEVSDEADVDSESAQEVSSEVNITPLNEAAVE